MVESNLKVGDPVYVIMKGSYYPANIIQIGQRGSKIGKIKVKVLGEYGRSKWVGKESLTRRVVKSKNKKCCNNGCGCPKEGDL